VSVESEERTRLVDEALAAWRQGDCVLGDCWFVHRFDPQRPLTDETTRAAAGDASVDLLESAVRGLMIASQSCDIVRSCKERPFVEVCPLVEMDEKELGQVKQGLRPRYVCVPGVAQRRMAADLDRAMTIEKAVVAAWHRTPGCGTDGERRGLALALARKRARFAFPDDFVRMTKKLQDRLRQKHDRDSPEGRALRALREIRVRAAPFWDASEIEITFWFVRDAEPLELHGKGWDAFLEAWMKLVPPQGRFRDVEGHAVTLDDLTARDYVDSDSLDLDYLSTRDG
jgi:hypothetical protein